MDIFQVPEGVNDVFRLSDEELGESYRFYEEVSTASSAPSRSRPRG
jgi:hypothetical protein